MGSRAPSGPTAAIVMVMGRDDRESFGHHVRHQALPARGARIAEKERLAVHSCYAERLGGGRWVFGGVDCAVESIASRTSEQRTRIPLTDFAGIRWSHGDRRAGGAR